MSEHVWVPADRLIRWEHCSRCLIIKRADNCNSPCKGAAAAWLTRRLP